MKLKNIYMLVLAAFVMVACDPNKEIYEEMEANPTPIATALEFTLSDDDYELSGNENAAKFGSFSTEDEAKEGIPNILGDKYPHLGDGASAKVTYDLYSPIRMSQDSYYELTSEDYDALDHRYGNLSSPFDIIEAAEYVIPNPLDNEVLELGYEWWTGSNAEDREDILTYYGGEWVVSYVPSNDDYYAMGQSFTNFDSRTTARNEIQNILNATYYVSAEDGDFRTSVFTYTYKDSDDNRQFDNFLIVFFFAEGQWNAIHDVSPRILQLGNDGSTWVPDNTIKYEMTGDDYALVATNYADINAAGVESMSRYGNYDLTIWSDDEVTNSIADVLAKNFGGESEGQQYLVTYSVWTGSAGDTPTKHYIKEGDVYVLSGR